MLLTEHFIIRFERSKSALGSRARDTGFTSGYIGVGPLMTKKRVPMSLPERQRGSDGTLDLGARHEKSSSRLRQRQKWQSSSDRHDAGPSQQGQIVSKGT